MRLGYLFPGEYLSQRSSITNDSIRASDVRGTSIAPQFFPRSTDLAEHSIDELLTIAGGLTTGPGNRSTGHLRRVPERFTGSLLITNVATNVGLSGSPGLANSLDSQLIQTLCPKYSGGQIIVDGRTDFLRSLSSSHIPIRDVPMNTIRQMQLSPARCCGAMIHRR